MADRSNAMTRLIVCSVTAVLLIIILIIGMTGLNIGNFSFDNIGINVYTYDRNTDSYNVGSGTVPAASAAAVKNINIDWISGDITVIASDGDEITIAEPDGLDIDRQLRWTVEGTTLRIAFYKNGTSNLTTNLNKALTLTVPASILAGLDTLDVDTVSADFEASGITAGSVDMEGVSGRVNLTGCTVGSLNFESVSGSLDFSGTLGKFDGESVSGKAEFSLPADASFTAEIDSVSGKVECGFATTVKGDRYICNGGNASFEFESVSGDLIINPVG